MTIQLNVTPELQRRIEALAARSNLTADQVVLDALENGHSLEWQERFIDKVALAIDAADRDDFATADDIEAVRNKYRPA